MKSTIHCKKCTLYIIPKLAKDFWKRTQNQIRLQCNKMWSHDSDHVGLTHQTFWNSDFVTELLIPDKKVFFSFKWLEIDGFKVLKWKNRVISHQKVNITRRPTFMEVQTAFSPPHQLFKSKMRTKSEEKHTSLHIDDPLKWRVWVVICNVVFLRGNQARQHCRLNIFFRYIV